MTNLVQILAASITLMAMSASSNAGVFKCKVGDKIVYSDTACPNAKAVNITNGKNPTPKDALRAELRGRSDQIDLITLKAKAELEKQKQARCNQMARDHTSKQADMIKYPSDIWWKNREANSRAELNAQCRDYLVP